MISFRLFSFLLLGLAVSCRPDTSSRAAQTAASEAPQQVKDDVGRLVTIPAHPRRIMALAPSMTEMLYAIADTSTIIARTQVCNYPAAIVHKPVVSSYPLDLERLVALHPDVVFTVSGITSPDDAARLEQLGIPVYFQQYETVKDVFRGMRDLGHLLGREEAARQLTDSLQQELRQLPPVTGPAPRVLAITWQDPIYVYGQNTLFTDKIRLAGGQNAVTEKFAQPYPALTREYILKLNPDVLIGGRFGKLDSTFFKSYPELRRIRAYQTRQVYPVTGNLMERPGPRTVESVRELQRLLAQGAARPLPQ
ncbi:ABC transporter substrate-binding protein [Hymenobacter taeanensis]|uniref:ABC transporter substrate-binding protein n=1 Tax=Hymenobacter taeanensis TaxID=2735321 RepID=A0A6M6BCF1_9BACT|nr:MULTISPECIES: ABC transporter substrate-binding protein [Hymenobacter]QJX45610.1 ABC transporter substrate-binding protein [Hymenobacter taeanensis]UOQ79442.1 ABC transporter substrate-binding protein [Hymenobacter sp. 5414T-23]